MISKSKTKIHDIDFLYEIHDKLTDKKLFKTITREEEEQLEKIRDEIESYNQDKDLINFYEDRIDKYKELLGEIKEIKRLLNNKKNKKIGDAID